MTVRSNEFYWSTAALTVTVVRKALGDRHMPDHPEQLVLSREEIESLVSILANLFNTEAARRVTITAAGLTSLLPEIDLSGPSNVFATRLIDYLGSYGQLTDPKNYQALGVLFDYLLSQSLVGQDQKHFIASLIIKYQLIDDQAYIARLQELYLKDYHQQEIVAFKIGDQVETTTIINLRRTPGYIGKPADDVVYPIPATDHLVILSDRSVRVDNLVWWNVRAALSTQELVDGWVTQSDPTGKSLLHLIQTPNDSRLIPGDATDATIATPSPKTKRRSRKTSSFTIKQLRMCTDVALPDELLAEANLVALEENPANQPEPSKSFELAVVNAKLWSPGRTLRIRFLDGDAVVQQKVAQVAQKWTQVANIYFEFGNHPQAEIRISFKGIGSWSQIGTDALVIKDQSQPTINFGWLTDKTLEQEYNRVVLHEFGHALGAIHEHNSPASGIPWNEPAVIAYYKQTNGWDEAKTRLTVVSRYNVGETNFTEFDPTSIMLYPIPHELTLNGFEIPWTNSQLSPRDKEFMAKMYPKT